jgi:hypothetical protein
MQRTVRAGHFTRLSKVEFGYVRHDYSYFQRTDRRAQRILNWLLTGSSGGHSEL